MEYDFRGIEEKWQKFWKENQTNRTLNDTSKPKYYVLDMFPYPSGAGLHVGHPLGYIASDIVARYKKLKGFNVLHPMGFDAFGLPAEQYAIQTGQHPRITTEENIKRYREQLDKIGFAFDWSREIRTSDPSYYKWTQWIFIRLYHHWFNPSVRKAEPIDTLITYLNQNGFNGSIYDIDVNVDGNFSADEWKNKSEKEQHDFLQQFRLAYLSEAWVNWCAALGTVLANDEVKDGVSERGGYPVERKRMPQWSLRITAYADRLLEDLEDIDWPESIKDSQRNWIGKSEGTSVQFQLKGHSGKFIEVFTTRPDTLFGVSFVTLAPEHELLNKITTSEYKTAVETYVNSAKNRSERERQADVKTISGQFTGAYVIHPFTGKNIPVWTGDYVLAGYGTGAVMAVPAHDARDFAFAGFFEKDLEKQLGESPFKIVIEPPSGKQIDFSITSYDDKEGTVIHSDFLNGLAVKNAIRKAIDIIEEKNIGKGKTNYRLRDAAFGRQRYWGEPIPVYYKNGMPQTLDDSELPLILPDIDKFQPTETGEPPLARASNWKYKGEFEYEHTTMPGWAGSSWYFLRYMDPQNDILPVSPEAVNYWKNVDFYLGGSEHATGHLLYVRFWTKFLFDLGLIPKPEPAQKLINQGMIQGISKMARVLPKGDTTYLLPLDHPRTEGEITTRIPVEFTSYKDGVPVITADGLSKLRSSYSLFGGFEFIDPNLVDIALTDEVEKMSKSKWNVVNPDDIIHDYGADTLRLYEMFLGPLEQSKPWSTQGISGVHNFLRRFWRLFHDKNEFRLSDDEPTSAELKTLHRTIKKVTEDIDRFSFNTTISTFMICVNELTDLKCNKRSILEPLIILLSPYAPHIAEELWSKTGKNHSVTVRKFPVWEEQYLNEENFEYPVSVNGKLRFKISLSLQLSKEQIEKEVLSSDEIGKYIAGNPKKVIVVPGRIVNVVV